MWNPYSEGDRAIAARVAPGRFCNGGWAKPRGRRDRERDDNTAESNREGDETSNMHHGQHSVSQRDRIGGSHRGCHRRYSTVYF